MVAIERAQTETVAARRAELYLQALLIHHRRGDFDGVRDVAHQLARAAEDGEPLATKLEDAQRFQLRAVMLELALAAGSETEVERLAASLRPTTSAQEAVAQRLRARALMVSRDHAAAALALMADAPRQLAAATVDASAYAAAIWRHLSKLPPPELRRLAATAPPAAAAWLNLAHNLNSALTSRQQAETWRRWASANSSHPAARLMPPSIASATVAPDNIALLIPLSGDIAAAAEAIRDGFLAAYLHAAENLAGNAQGVRLYDTGAMTIAEAYRQALADGAEIVVGPLEKAAVRQLAALHPSRSALPVVALNNLADNPGGGIYRISLAVEDDAAAIAAALVAAGAERIVVFEDRSRWAERALQQFDTELDAVEIVGIGRLDGIANAADVAGEVLGIADSNARRSMLSRLLGEDLEFVPRRRDDVDAVVVFLDGARLMALKPALDFHYASDLPVFAPSQAIQGVAWSRLNGLRVCDIPWRLHPTPLRRRAAAFAAGGSDFFALGVDAFRIANQLPRMIDHGESLAGATGLLTLERNGRIHRRLAWGEVIGDRLVAVPAP